MDFLRFLRTVIFRPYREGCGPCFTLLMWDTGRCGAEGRTKIGYRLVQKNGERLVIVFKGDDFLASPCHADDADATVEALMSFLTLRPGDTDAEYFDSYTDAQRQYCDDHAESLAATVEDWFAETGGVS